MPGRPRGGKNERATLRKLAGQYGPESIEQLFILATTAESDAVRVMACREILDRAYGKPEQPLAEEAGMGMSEELRQFLVPRHGRLPN